MANPNRFTVYFVDPVKTRRDEAEAALKWRFVTAGFGTVGAAITAARDQPPHAVVFSIRQFDNNGVAAAAAIRPVVGSRALLVVVGAADSAMTAEHRQQIAQRNSVDTWLPRPTDGHTLDVLLWSELMVRFLPRELRAGPPAPTLVERVRRISGSDVLEFFTKDRFALARPPSPEGS